MTNTRSDGDDGTVAVAKRIARRPIDAATRISILPNERLCIAPCYQFFWGDRSRKYFSARINVEGDVKYWEIIADNLSKAGWSWGCVSAIDSRGRTIFVADAHWDEEGEETVTLLGHYNDEFAEHLQRPEGA